MEMNNIRRGFTLAENEVAVYKNGHSRGFLSGIYTTLEIQGGDPRLQPSGMTPNLMGFTLIELLVVVLIIGLLAAVALPQYQMAVGKARYMELMSIGSSLAQAEEIFYLSNNTYTRNLENLDMEFPDSSVHIEWLDDAIIKVSHKNINPFYIIYLTHLEGGWSGKRECRTATNSDIGQKICRSLTGKQLKALSPGIAYAVFD